MKTPVCLQKLCWNLQVELVPYLKKIKEILASRGVWLRYDQKAMKKQGESNSHVDAYNFEVWLSLGADGYSFPTSTGRLDRAALLGNTTLGAGYYSKVYKGMVQTTLDKAIKHVNNLIDDGMDYHHWVRSQRTNAKRRFVER